MKIVIKKRSLEERKLFFMRNLYKVNHLKKEESKTNAEILPIQNLKKKNKSETPH